MGGNYYLPLHLLKSTATVGADDHERRALNQNGMKLAFLTKVGTKYQVFLSRQLYFDALGHPTNRRTKK